MLLKTRLLASFLAIVALAACGGGSPASPSSGGTTPGSAGAVIAGTVTMAGGQGVFAGSQQGESSSSVTRPNAGPFSGLSVRVVGSNRSVPVSDNGVFQISEVPGGGVKLQFSSDSVNATTTEISNVRGDQFIEIRVQVSSTSAVIVNETRSGKVTLCHAEGNGTYHSITVSDDAEAAHRAHGDGKVGDPVPGQPGRTFDNNCRPVGPAIQIEKTTNGEEADNAPGPSIVVGNSVTWEYRVTNTGTVNLTGLQVSDDRGVAVNCQGQTTLAPGASVTCVGTGVAVLGQYRNVGTARADWSANGTSGSVSASDPSHYLGVNPTQQEEPKVTLCHRTGAGFFNLITVSVSAEPGHLAHGDGRPGGPVPGQSGKTFSATCTVQ